MLTKFRRDWFPTLEGATEKKITSEIKTENTKIFKNIIYKKTVFSYMATY